MSNIQTNSWLMDRRTALRGMGSFIALPLLNSMVAAKPKTADQQPRRSVFICLLYTSPSPRD